MVRHGCGNGTGDGLEGAVRGRMWGTYLHGPVLARNPALADHLLSLVVGPLGPLDDRESEALRQERLGAVRDPGDRVRQGVRRLYLRAPFAARAGRRGPP